MYQNISHDVILWRIDVAIKDTKKSIEKMKSLRSDVQAEYERIPKLSRRSMPARRLTVQAHYYYRPATNMWSEYSSDAMPHIRIIGQWVRKAGFEVGDKVIVTLENGKLIIAKAELEAILERPKETRTVRPQETQPVPLFNSFFNPVCKYYPADPAIF